MPANRTPIGWALPNKATAIASNPMPAEKPGVALPNTPAIWHAPARPAKRPAILIASTIVIAGFILLSTACSGGGADSNKKVADPCRDDSSDRIGKVEEYQNEENETLRGIRTHTKRKVVLMPVSSAGGGGGGYNPMMMAGGGGGAALAPFATEIMNQAFLNEGIKTVAWFKVSKELKKVGCKFSIVFRLTICDLA